MTVSDPTQPITVNGPLASSASSVTVAATGVVVTAGTTAAVAGLIWGGGGVTLDVPAITVAGGTIRRAPRPSQWFWARRARTPFS